MTDGAHPRVAVVAHNGKTFAGGLGELRDVLAARGVTDPMWFEVPKSRKVPARVRQAVEAGAELVYVWGGDGSVQRAVDALASLRAEGESSSEKKKKKKKNKDKDKSKSKSKNEDATHEDSKQNEESQDDTGADSYDVTRVRLAILPAGTANLLASNLGIPKDLERAVDIGLTGADRVLDIGRMNGEHFAVMAGMGLDSLMMKDADSGLKERFGRAAYVWTGARAVRRAPTEMKIRVDGHVWFDGEASCFLVGNVGEILGGISAFERAKTDDGLLDLAVITADGALQWARTLARAAFGHGERSKLVRTTMAKRIQVTTTTALPYEIDGGVRKKTTELKVRVVPAAITIKVLPD